MSNTVDLNHGSGAIYGMASPSTQRRNKLKASVFRRWSKYSNRARVVRQIECDPYAVEGELNAWRKALGRLRPPEPYQTWHSMEADLRTRGHIRHDLPWVTRAP